MRKDGCTAPELRGDPFGHHLERVARSGNVRNIDGGGDKLQPGLGPPRLEGIPTMRRRINATGSDNKTSVERPSRTSDDP